MKEIQKFISGFKHFRNNYFCCEDSIFDELRHGQHPQAMVIACSDSRTDPAQILQCEPGDIFVVRNVANIVPPYETATGYHGVSSAIEFAVKGLKVSDIIILGHSDCGGINALMYQTVSEGSEFLGHWLNLLSGAREKVLDHFGEIDKRACTACEMAGILSSLENLMSFPFVRERVEAGSLDLHGWYFDMETGGLMGYKTETGTFESLLQAGEDTSGVAA